MVADFGSAACGGVVGVVARVFIESGGAVGTGNHIKYDMRIVAVGTFDIVGIAWNHSALTNKPRNLSEREVGADVSATFEAAAKVGAIPCSLGEPYVFADSLTFGGFGDGSYYDVVAEEILAGVGVCLIGFRVSVVHWAADTYAGLIAVAGCGIDVGKKSVAEFHDVAHDGHFGIFPYTALNVALI